MRWLVVLAWLGACGRIGFDGHFGSNDGPTQDQEGLASDGAGGDVALDDAGNFVGDVRVSNAPGFSLQSSVASSPTGYAIAWWERNVEHVYVSRLAHDGTVSSPTDVGPVSASTNPRASLCWVGTAWFVAWVGSDNEVHLARVETDGTLTFSRAITINSGTLSVDGRLEALGSNIAMVWEDGRDDAAGEIYAAQLDPTGNPAATDITVTAASGSSLSPDLATRGTDLGVAYLHKSGMTTDVEVRLIVAGTVGAAAVLSTTGDASTPKIVATQAGYLVSWRSASGVQARALDTTGTISSNVVTIAAGGEGELAAGSVGSLAAWTVASATSSVWTRSVDDAGVGTTAAAVVATSTRAREPSLAFDGTCFVLSYDDDPTDSGNIEIYARRICG